MRLAIAVLAVLTCWSAALSSRAAATRTQVIPLHAGWNAVFLEIQPAASKPAEAFAGLPVETVSTFVPARLQAQYLRNPGDAPWRDEGWITWHSQVHAEAFLSSLHDLQAERAYLIRATADTTWTVTGTVRASTVTWYPNACTFTGLPVDPAAPPTFSQFFEGSPAHQPLRIFRLEGDSWKLVRDPVSDRIRSGEAYWIETRGASSFQGPLDLSGTAAGVLDFPANGGARTLLVANTSPGTSAALRVEVLSLLAPGIAPLPLTLVRRDSATSGSSRVALQDVSQIGTLGPKDRVSLRLEPGRLNLQGASAGALLRLVDGRGTQRWVPVRYQPDALHAAAHQP